MCPFLCQDEQLDTFCTELNINQLGDKLGKTPFNCILQMQQAHS